MTQMEGAMEVRSAAGLYEQHQRELIRFATTLVGPSDAADVVSDAVESLLRSGRLENAEHPRALLHRAVFAKARSMQRSGFRRRARERRFVEDLVSATPDLRPDVVRAVVGLSPQQRACVYLTYWNDFTPAQVGQWLGISGGSVKRHLARARAHLREVIHD
jgi:RNA polymerase sigma factor (sigma-70 family)